MCQSLSPTLLDPWDLGSLATADLFLLQSIRLWCGRGGATPDSPRDWRRGFLAAGIDGSGVVAFDGAMALLAEGARPRLRVHAPCCRHVARDEAVILGLVREAQAGKASEIAARMRRRWPDAVARLALPDILRLALAFGDVGLFCGTAGAASGLHAPPAGPTAAAFVH
jgi:hypothetical protein